MDDTVPMDTDFDKLGGNVHDIRQASAFHERYYKTWCLEDLEKAIHLYQGAVNTLLWHVGLCTGCGFSSEGVLASFDGSHVMCPHLHHLQPINSTLTTRANSWSV